MYLRNIIIYKHLFNVSIVRIKVARSTIGYSEAVGYVAMAYCDCVCLRLVLILVVKILGGGGTSSELW
jgi:hypothetical protein